MRYAKLRFATVCFAVALAGCGGGAAAVPGGRLHVVTTTTLLASLGSAVGAGRADVDALTPVGASPETYEPTPGDVARLAAAQVVVRNGAGLDGWLDATLASANARAPVVTCADGLPLIDGNPHLWLDPAFARAYVDRMRDGFIRADPDGTAIYRRNASALDARLDALDRDIRRLLASLGPGRRGMIVFHDAWAYYNRRYGLQTLGVIEERPGTEPSAAHLARLVDVARGARLRTIFAEPEYNPKLIDAVARSAGISNVAVLYDDSVGTTPQTRDYIAMLETDTHTIVDGLK